MWTDRLGVQVMADDVLMVPRLHRSSGEPVHAEAADDDPITLRLADRGVRGVVLYKKFPVKFERLQNCERQTMQ